MQISEAKKKEGRFCCAYACSNAPVKKKGGLCHKHYKRKLRETDPVQVRYNQWKGSAKRRGKEFNVTLEEFRKFCQDTGYIIKPGKRGRAASLDRDLNWKGYSIDNLVIMPIRSNVRKYYDYDRYQEPPPDYYDNPPPPPADLGSFSDTDDLPF